MPKKGENITKRKDGRYEARYVKERDELGRIKKYGFVYAKNYFEVKKKREEKLRNLKTETNREKLFQENTVANSIIAWLESKILIKDSSYTNYYSIIYSKIIPFFKTNRLNEFDENLILKFIKSLQEQNLGNKRIKDILIVLKQFLDYKNIHIKFEMPKIKKNKIITLTEEELFKIKTAAKNSSNIKEFAILLVLFTGLRIGELCALTWKDIDLKSKVIHVNKTIIRVRNKNKNDNKKTKIIMDVPKTQNSIRDIPIHKDILSYLKKFKKDDDCYILTENSSFITTKKYYYFYLNFLKSLSINKHKFHILRHTFATRSLFCGIDIKTLSEILGHSSVKTTLDLYVHVTENEKLLQINKLTLVNL